MWSSQDSIVKVLAHRRASNRAGWRNTRPNGDAGVELGTLGQESRVDVEPQQPPATPATRHLQGPAPSSSLYGEGDDAETKSSETATADADMVRARFCLPPSALDLRNQDLIYDVLDLGTNSDLTTAQQARMSFVDLANYYRQQCDLLQVRACGHVALALQLGLETVSTTFSAPGMLSGGASSRDQPSAFPLFHAGLELLGRSHLPTQSPIGGSFVGGGGALVLYPLLKTLQLRQVSAFVEHLDLRDSGVGDVGCALLHSGYSAMLQVKSLKLAYCGIGGRGSAYLASALIKYRHRSRLALLDLRGNRIGRGADDQKGTAENLFGAVLLAKAVAICPALVHLDLSQNLLAERGMKLFVAAGHERKALLGSEEDWSKSTSLVRAGFGGTANNGYSYTPGGSGTTWTWKDKIVSSGGGRGGGGVPRAGAGKRTSDDRNRSQQHSQPLGRIAHSGIAAEKSGSLPLANAEFLPARMGIFGDRSSGGDASSSRQSQTSGSSPRLEGSVLVPEQGLAFSPTTSAATDQIDEEFCEEVVVQPEEDDPLLRKHHEPEFCEEVAQPEEDPLLRSEAFPSTEKDAAEDAVPMKKKRFRFWDGWRGAFDGSGFPCACCVGLWGSSEEAHHTPEQRGVEELPGTESWNNARARTRTALEESLDAQLLAEDWAEVEGRGRGLEDPKRHKNEYDKSSYVPCYINIVPGNFMTSEILNAFTHGIGVAIIPLLGWRLFNKFEGANPDSKLNTSNAGLSLGTFLFSGGVMFLNSCIYHSLFYVVSITQAMQVLDHSGIYALISGTYLPIITIGCACEAQDGNNSPPNDGGATTTSPDTPETGGSPSSDRFFLHNPLQHVSLGPTLILWCYFVLTFVGFTISITHHAKKWYPTFVVIMYLIMGFMGAPYLWVNCFQIEPQKVNENAPKAKALQAEVLSHYAWAKGLVVTGGALYVIGVYFFIQKRYPFFHVIWHLFVFVAFCTHYKAIESVVDATLAKKELYELAAVQG